jgi:mRNA interferase MazF
VRGDVHRLVKATGARGHEKDGNHFAVIIQSDDIGLSTVLVCPTSRSAPARSWRPEIAVLDEKTRVLTEQTSAVSPARLGVWVGQLSMQEMLDIEAALKTVLGFLI